MQEIGLRDLDLYKIGNSIQLVGALYQEYGKTYLVVLPGEALADREPIILKMDLGDWERFLRQTDLLEIVITMLLYISSPNDDTGWIEYSKKPPTERHKQGWEQFLEFATPCPKNFSFRKYEKQQEHRRTTDSIGTPTGTLTTPDLREYATTLGSMASPAQFIPPQPSRLPPLIVPLDPMNNAEFLRYLGTCVDTIVEFMSPDAMREIIRRFASILNHNRFIFIKEIELNEARVFIIRGWSPEGERQEMVNLSLGISIRPREQRAIRFYPPSWFRDVGGAQNLHYYNMDMQPVPMNGSIVASTDAYYPITTTNGGTSA